MSSRCVEKLPCKDCGSKTALQVFEEKDGSFTGFCFACPEGKGYKGDPYNGGKPSTAPRPVKSPEEIAAEIAEVGTFKSLDVPARKLRGSTLEKFGAKVSVSEFDGTTPTAIYYPLTREGVLVGYHIKGLIKKADGKSFIYNLGDAKGADLLNWENAKTSGAYRLIITEGPEDMASVDRIYEMYNTNKEYHPAVVSLPAGAGSAKKVLQKHAADINRLFKEVVLCFDNDDVGKQAVKEAVMVLPKAKSVTLPHKDANDCLVKGVAKAAYKALAFQQETPKNTRIILGRDLHEAAKEPPKFGELSWPWEGLNDDMRGLRLGETTYVGAGTKMGKTTLKNCLSAHLMAHDGVKVFMADIEESNENTYKLLANQLTGKVFHDPKIEFDEDAFNIAGEVLRDRLYLLDLYQHVGWSTLKEDIKVAVEEGCQAVMIDPVTCLTNGINSADANTILQEFASELASMAKDLRFHAMIYCHLKAPEGNLSEERRERYYSKEQYMDLGPIPHEWGGSVYSSQFAGSRAMQRSCHLMLGLLGNKDPDLPEEVRNTRQLTILEDRKWGNSGNYKLFYNKNTGLFSPC